jgi:hypothetical protein
MAYNFYKAYELTRSRVTYETTTSFGYKKIIKDNRFKECPPTDVGDLITTPAGEEIHRKVILFNKVYSFYYYIPITALKDLPTRFNYANNDSVVVAGIHIPKHKGLVLELTSTKIIAEVDEKDQPVYRIDVLIEVENEKPLLYTSVPLRGFYFKHPQTHNKTRIQFSSNPYEYLKDKGKYPYACEVCNGYGFYSEDRPDLNVSEPVFLDKEGGILTEGENPVFTKVYEKKVADWRGLGLPKEEGVEE